MTQDSNFRSPILFIAFDPNHPLVKELLIKAGQDAIVRIHEADPTNTTMSHIPQGMPIDMSKRQQAHAYMVYAVFKPKTGYSSGDLERTTGFSRSQVRHALKILEANGKVFRFGQWRFSKYALDPKTAQAASEVAMQMAKQARGATGPISILQHHAPSTTPEEVLGEAPGDDEVDDEYDEEPPVK